MKDIEEMKCSSCIHFPLCLAQKGGMNLGLASENNCEYYQPKLPEDIVMLTREGYDILIAVENERIKEERKKTVREFAKKGKEQFPEKLGFYTGEDICDTFDEIAKQFNIEVEQ